MKSLLAKPEFLIGGILVLLFSACTQKSSTPSDPQALLIERGRKAYTNHCIACHNMDPHKDGAIGPAIFGSSLELLEARVLRAEYPLGYTPKRKTHAMAALPFAKDELPALYAYLNN